MSTREELKIAIQAGKAAVAFAEAALADFDAKAENNVFETLDEANGTIEDKLRAEARNDCEGSDNCGADTYTQDFIFGGLKYRGTLNVEYDRHDKTYYYVDRASYSHAPLVEETPAG